LTKIYYEGKEFHSYQPFGTHVYVGSQPLFSVYQTRKKDFRIPPQEYQDLSNIKLLNVGDGAVGKTCYLIRLAKNAFPRDYIPTVFDNYDLPFMIENQQYECGLWDTAGPEEYDKLRPLSYPGANIFIIMFSVLSPASLSNVETKWIQEVRHHCPNVPILLIGSKIDLRENEDIIKKLDSRGQKPITFEEGVKMAKKRQIVLLIVKFPL